MIKTYEKQLTLLFTVLSLVFIGLMAMNETFFNWSFARHHNVLSWYIRPMFLIPFAYFSYKKQPIGISVTIFFLLTSMFWFPEPAAVNAQVKEFLNMEKVFLTSGWSMAKLFFAFIVVFSLSSLSYALWKRNKKAGIFILILIALGKVGWSVLEGGSAGASIIIPASIGLAVCITFVYYVFKRADKKA